MQCFGWRMLGQETTKMEIIFSRNIWYLSIIVVIYQTADIFIFPLVLQPKEGQSLLFIEASQSR
jgi:hypothetical protein